MKRFAYIMEKLKKATFNISMPETLLSVVWTDPDFNPISPIAYYVRVFEIPTPRWSTFDAVALGVPNPDDIVPPTIQERAWSTPIWYTPQKNKKSIKQDFKHRVQVSPGRGVFLIDTGLL
jgi:hypothetical protein